VQVAPSRALRFDANVKWLFTELPFEHRFAAAAQHGFDAVEIPAPYAYPASTLTQWLADAGLLLVLINSPGGEPGSPSAYGNACHPGSLAEFRAGFELALEYATALPTRLIHLMAGVVPPEVPHERAKATYLENLAWAAQAARATDITILVEVLNQRDAPGFVLRSLAEAAEAISAAGGAQSRLLFDVYHVQVNQGDPTTRWRELSPIVGHVQIADSPGRHEPGTGELRWDYLFGEIAAAGYDGWIGCEYRPIADTASSLGWRDAYASPQRAKQPR
jgi:hydroxypyruvate isomerase